MLITTFSCTVVVPGTGLAGALTTEVRPFCGADGGVPDTCGAVVVLSVRGLWTRAAVVMTEGLIGEGTIATAGLAHDLSAISPLGKVVFPNKGLTKFVAAVVTTGSVVILLF